MLNNQDHHWFYFPEMTKDECLILKNFDSSEDVARMAGHASFRIPGTSGDAPVRESIEIRVIAFFDDDDKEDETGGGGDTAEKSKL